MTKLEFLTEVSKLIKKFFGEGSEKYLSNLSKDTTILVNNIFTLKVSDSQVYISSLEENNLIITLPPKYEDCLDILNLQIKYTNDHYEDLLTTISLVDNYIDKNFNKTEKEFFVSNTLFPSTATEGLFTMRILRYNPIDVAFMRQGDSISSYIDIVHYGSVLDKSKVTAQSTWNLSIYNRGHNWVERAKEVDPKTVVEGNYINFSFKSDKILLDDILNSGIDPFRVTLGWNYLMKVVDDNYCGCVRTSAY